MADFNTHVFSAAVLASVGAAVCTKVFNLPPETALLLSAAGVLGGVLPDIDLKYSVPSKALFSAIAVFICLTWLLANIARYSVLELSVATAAIYCFFRYPIWALFHQFTVHRGALHSLAALLMFGLISAVVGFHWMGLSEALSWLLALFVSMGFALHLILDEIYSVDFMGARIKRSFGTALKVIDSERLPASCVILFISLVAWFWTPDADSVLELGRNVQPDWKTVLLPHYLLKP